MGTLALSACGGGGDDTSAPPAAASPAGVAGSDSSGLPDVVPLSGPLEAPSEVAEEMKIIWEAWAHLTRDYVDRSDLDPEELAEAAIRGMLKALGDQHTAYVEPETFQIESQNLQGEFEGIGATVSTRQDGTIIIVSPIKGGPAEAAGIRPGDLVLEVDGESLAGLSLLDAVGKIRGPRGSTVILLIKHLGAIDPVEIEVVRDVIPLVSVLLRSELGDRIAHIRLTNFYADTPDKLSKTIKDVVSAGAEGLIIDVRDNPGGLIGSVVGVVSQFLDVDDFPSKDEAVILYEIDGAGRRNNWTVRDGGVATDIPMVVLANEFSASASEILVGAMQDYDRATVVGASTFGKGTVNILRRLSNEGGIYITSARWFTPIGRLIEGEGLEPDIEVVSRDRRTAETLQLEKAIETLEAKLGSSTDGGDTRS